MVIWICVCGFLLFTLLCKIVPIGSQTFPCMGDPALTAFGCGFMIVLFKYVYGLVLYFVQFCLVQVSATAKKDLLF